MKRVEILADAGSQKAIARIKQVQKYLVSLVISAARRQKVDPVPADQRQAAGGAEHPAGSLAAQPYARTLVVPLEICSKSQAIRHAAWDGLIGYWKTI